MPESQYAVVFSGRLVEGAEQEQVKARFGRLTRLEPGKVEALFSGRRMILKRFPAEREARRAAEKLRQIGMLVELVPVAARGTAPASLPVAAPKAEKDSPAEVGKERPAPARKETASPIPAAKTPPSPNLSGGSDEMPSRTRDMRERRLPFVFTGTGTEFFRIWIVNVLLSILTLGIYSAWAKVRTQRYFYGNTLLDGSAFEYLADPVKILKGRLMVFAFFLVNSLAVRSVPVDIALAVNQVFGLITLALLPWVIRQSLRFQRRNSAWRGVRFGFAGNMKDAAYSFILWPALAFLQLLPVAWQRQTLYLVDNSRYGTASFSNSATVRNFYGMYLSFSVAFLLFATVAGYAGYGLTQRPTFDASVLLTYIYGFLAAAYLVLFPLYKVKMTNLRWGKSGIGPHRLDCHYEFFSYFWLVLSNTLGILLTLGLFYPFAKVRTARYAAGHVELVALGGLDGFVAEEQAEVSALGSEAGEYMDIDIGF